MCYSPEASFGTAVALIPAGSYCVIRAWTRNRRFLPLAAIPLGLAVQQAFEGWVWLALHGRLTDVTTPALGFLFFALAFWPFWVSLQAAVSERRPAAHAFLWAWTGLAAGWFYVHLYPLVNDPSLLSVSVVHHSVRYDFPNLPAYHDVPRPWVRLAYLITIVVPFVVGKGGPGTGWVGAALLAGSAAITALVFEYAFASVWCLFAAVMSFYLCVVFRHVPLPPTPEVIREFGWEG